jgi:hypothetical protein
MTTATRAPMQAHLTALSPSTTPTLNTSMATRGLVLALENDPLGFNVVDGFNQGPSR